MINELKLEAMETWTVKKKKYFNRWYFKKLIKFYCKKRNFCGIIQKHMANARKKLKEVKIKKLK